MMMMMLVNYLISLNLIKKKTLTLKILLSKQILFIDFWKIDHLFRVKIINFKTMIN